MISITDPSDAPQPEHKQMAPSSAALEEFNTKLLAFPTPEEKVAYGLQFMRDSISQEGSPHFREFWEARRLVLPIFKENLNPAIRSKLWNEYVELTVEARRLKEILNEQSAFAMEQIDLAIQSIEGDLTNFETLLAAHPVDFPQVCDSISQTLELYRVLQQELNLLNTLASRLNALRKEVVKTDMRIRFKAKFFKRLSELGDRIFPRRKELIEKISSAFESDIERFVQKYFKGEGRSEVPYYALRSEIKALQGMAKVFTLSSGAFNRTRVKLSECWDFVRSLEEEYKKEAFEKTKASSEQREFFEKKIEELKEHIPGMTLRDLDGEIDALVKEMRTVSLHHYDVRFLRDELAKLRAPLVEIQEQKARELEEAEREALRIRREKIEQVKEDANQLLKEEDELPLESFQERLSELLTILETIGISKVEKERIEQVIFRPLKDLLADKKERAFLENLSDDDRETLKSLKEVLHQKKQRRQEIKETLDAMQREASGSGLDFERAMHLSETIDQEKERLDKANLGIQEVEEKISQLES